MESPHTLPLLSSDRVSSLNIDVDTPSSPFPPSSPPMFPVPVSFSVSPLLFGRVPFPLSEVPDNEDASMDVLELMDDDVSFDVAFSDFVLIPIPLVLKLLRLDLPLSSSRP